MITIGVSEVRTTFSALLAIRHDLLLAALDRALRTAARKSRVPLLPS
jgi:hypothetical protein